MTSKRWIVVAGALLLITVAGGLVIGYPNAKPDFDPLGEGGRYCEVEPLDVPAPRSGYAISARRTTCGQFGSAFMICVFLYPEDGGEANSGSLILRYEEEPAAKAPRIEWAGDRRLHISIGKPVHISKQVAKLLEVHIDVDSDGELFPELAR